MVGNEHVAHLLAQGAAELALLHEKVVHGPAGTRPGVRAEAGEMQGMSTSLQEQPRADTHIASEEVQLAIPRLLPRLGRHTAVVRLVLAEEAFRRGLFRGRLGAGSGVRAVWILITGTPAEVYLRMQRTDSCSLAEADEVERLVRCCPANNAFKTFCRVTARVAVGSFVVEVRLKLCLVSALFTGLGVRAGELHGALLHAFDRSLLCEFRSGSCLGFRFLRPLRLVPYPRHDCLAVLILFQRLQQPAHGVLHGHVLSKGLHSREDLDQLASAKRGDAREEAPVATLAAIASVHIRALPALHLERQGEQLDATQLHQFAV
mmetsp:Transcript_1801/g.7881  ORF Transcript_1801/g.7881 Transcript_1801/m.7881 type:complete len:319 (-) Transcript_1801:3812-4768(-)|eukprot:scaffold1778_cov246-Pinguiococcus_pyrenoidosus.AAC.6